MKIELEDLQPFREIFGAVVREELKALSTRGKVSETLLTPDEVAGLLKVKKAQIYAWVNESKYTDNGIPYLKAGKFLRFNQREVFEWMKRNRER